MMYKEHILDLWKNPENFGPLDKAKSKRGLNASCGDDITIYLQGRGLVENVSFDGHGCALCIASASVVTSAVKGQSFEQVLKMDSRSVCELLDVDVNPARLRCVLLPLETLQKLIREGDFDVRSN